MPGGQLLFLMPMRVLIAFNEPVLPRTHPEFESEREILEAAASIAAHLDRRGIDVTQCGIGRNLAGFCKMLRRAQPDLVLNLFEGFGDDPGSECEFAGLLENEGVPFTGCSSATLWRAGRKDIAKQVLSRAGLPTPPFASPCSSPSAVFTSGTCCAVNAKPVWLFFSRER